MGWVLRIYRLLAAGAVLGRNRVLRFRAWNAFHQRKRNIWLRA